MKKLLIAFIICCNIQLQAQTVSIAAAGNLRYILEEIKTFYEVANPNANLTITLSSSGALYQQIANGAPYDIFMAADIKYPTKLKEQGFVKGDVKTYAFGKLILWSNTIDVSKGISILTNENVHRIAVAKPKIAPYGDRAIECLNYYNIFDQIKDKIVYADNIAQTAQFAQTGNAEVGIIALALIKSPGMEGNYFILDTKSYKPVEQAMVLTNSPQSNPEAAKFMNFVLSAECAPIFEKYGFVVPSN